ncbi:T9SS type A sorting domain-containing protein [Flavobacterium sinopsychrotolerans]|uniref:Por secretion system C-terminal sorting domain-containing protein n=1 Tax=Flavobacterium sinopsychrotolerans TaxID=604089 RepID=A0A1H8RIN1_9FLAO|nr:T9SS type A sorting domain-containing protein [Flavobacterium sinopsychrotolerans]SEO66014.1 Por secretion system C-terminal sorting domain-containing protein [Flavobacterium sinopsychrotolerans]
MKKKITIIILILFWQFKSYGQTISINSLTINNVSINSSGPINIQANATIANISLNTQVVFSSPQNNSGTINIYYQKSKTSPILTANGGNGGFLLFLGGNTASRNFTLTISPVEFDQSGGYIFAEYKTSSGIAYKSQNIPIVKTVPLPNNPPSPVNPDYAEQRIPYGGIPLMPSLVNYYESSQDWVDSSTDRVIFSERDKGVLYDNVNIRQKTTFQDGRTLKDPQVMFVKVAKFLPNISRLSINNYIISGDQYVYDGQKPKTIIGEQATASYSRTTVNLNYYQWQSRKIYPFWWVNIENQFKLYGWNDIPEATEINYTPPTATIGMGYRRLVLEDPSNKSIDRNCASSNIIRVLPMSDKTITNNICCDQTVTSIADPIQGEISRFDSYWQSSSDNINWTSIQTSANKKDYTPINTSRNTKPIFYRRIDVEYTSDTNSIYYISNTVKINYNPLSTTDPSIKIYPNPTTSILNIENTGNAVTFSNITINDTSGTAFIPNSISTINSNFTSLNVSNLPPGIYFLNMFVKPSYTTRGYTFQTTFVKQ